MRTARLLLALLLALGVAPAHAAPLFQAGPGVAAIESGATGIFELGTVSLANATVALRALLQNGHVLQVHSRHDGRWLARRSGSAGGKPVTPTSFDALTAIAGGMNIDVRRLQQAKRQQFVTTAGLVVLEDDPGTTRTQSQGERAVVMPSSNAVARCAATTCLISTGRAGTAASFTIALDDDSSTWSFTGYGIVAIWPVPQAALPR